MTNKQEELLIKQLIGIILKLGKLDKFTSYENYKLIMECKDSLQCALENLIQCDKIE